MATRSLLMADHFSRIYDRRTKPVINPYVWGKVPDGHVGETVGLGKHDEGSDSDGNSKIAQQNEFGILGLIERAAWVEVVDAVEETV